MTHDDCEHADPILSSRPETSKHEDDDRHGNGGDGEAELGVLGFLGDDDDDELHGEAQEEEKVKLEQGDIDLQQVSMPRTTCPVGDNTSYLIGQISPLHPQIRADVLVYRPSKLIVELPSDEEHEQSAQSEHGRNRNQERSRITPEGSDWVAGIRVVPVPGRPQILHGLANLLHLHGGVDQEPDVVYAQSDHLNRVLEPQRVPY